MIQFSSIVISSTHVIDGIINDAYTSAHQEESAWNNYCRAQFLFLVQLITVKNRRFLRENAHASTAKK